MTVATREEAELLRAKIIQEAQQAMPSAQDRDITVDAYADRWLKQIGASVEPRTLECYTEEPQVTHPPCIRPCQGQGSAPRPHQGLAREEARRRTEQEQRAAHQGDAIGHAR